MPEQRSHPPQTSSSLGPPRRGFALSRNPRLGLQKPHNILHCGLLRTIFFKLVTSSCLCKNSEGAGFPFQVEALEDGVDDTIHAFDVHKAHHGPGAAADLDEAALDDISGAQFLPEVPGEAEKRQQLRQIALQLPHHGPIQRLPAPAEGAKPGCGLAPTVGAIDRLGIGFDCIMVATAYFLQDIPHLVHPAALMQRSRVDGLDRGRQSGTTIGDDQQQLLAFQPTPVQILEQPFPGSLAFPRLRRKPSSCRVPSPRTP